MLNETVEQFSNQLYDICARIVNDPGEVMKKTHVIKGICNELLSFLRSKQGKICLGQNTASAS